MIKRLQPSSDLIALATAMFKKAWSDREAKASEATALLKHQLRGMDREMDKVLARLMETESQAAIRAYESKLAELEKTKALLTEKIAQSRHPRASMADNLETALQFLSSPWKLWETGNIHLRRLVLKLAFADRIKYGRFEGPRTPEIALPFNALGGDLALEDGNGGRPWNRTKRESPRGSYSPLPHLAACRPPVGSSCRM